MAPLRATIVPGLGEEGQPAGGSSARCDPPRRSRCSKAAASPGICLRHKVARAQCRYPGPGLLHAEGDDPVFPDWW